MHRNEDTNDARKCHDCDYKNNTANFYELSVNIRPDQDIYFAQKETFPLPAKGCTVLLWSVEVIALEVH